MKIFLNSKERALLSTEESGEIVKLARNQGIRDVTLVNSSESEDFLNILSNEILLSNLAELQLDALKLEERVKNLQERNDYLEEKVDWLRSKAGEDNFIPSKGKLGSGFSLGDSSLQSALVEVINTIESNVRVRAGLSFSKSKRVRKDKALISKSEYFDKEYVVSQLKQLGLQVKDPLEFFVSFAAGLELSPSDKFDTKSYLAMNPDVKNSGINPLLHYIKHGKAEGRVII